MGGWVASIIHLQPAHTHTHSCFPSFFLAFLLFPCFTTTDTVFSPPPLSMGINQAEEGREGNFFLVVVSLSLLFSLFFIGKSSVVCA